MTAPGQRLTPAEEHVLALLAEGARGHEINQALGVSSSTTGRCIRGVLTKLGARTCAHAVAIAHRQAIACVEDQRDRLVAEQVKRIRELTVRLRCDPVPLAAAYADLIDAALDGTEAGRG